MAVERHELARGAQAAFGHYDRYGNSCSDDIGYISPAVGKKIVDGVPLTDAEEWQILGGRLLE